MARSLSAPDQVHFPEPDILLLNRQKWHCKFHNGVPHTLFVPHVDRGFYDRRSFGDEITISAAYNERRVWGKATAKSIQKIIKGIAKSMINRQYLLIFPVCFCHLMP